VAEQVEPRAPPRAAPPALAAGCLRRQTEGSGSGTGQTRVGARSLQASTPAHASARAPTIT
jgi:hypothetical protein